MDMGLDEAGDDETATAIANLKSGVLPPSRFPLPRPFPRPFYRRYPPARHYHIRPHYTPSALVQQHLAAREDQLGSLGQDGAQVVIRGCTAVESSEMSK